MFGELKVRKSGCNVECGRGEGQMRRECCPHWTLERSAMQMVGSLIRDQALGVGE